MKLQTVILAVALVNIIGPAAAISYTNCPLVKQLNNNGITTNVPDWNCLVIATSWGDTDIIRGPNSDGNYTYGIFQISSRYWCGLNGPGGDCNIACSDLVDNDITDDIACAKTIYARHGFSAWEGWVAQCQSTLGYC